MYITYYSILLFNTGDFIEGTVIMEVLSSKIEKKRKISYKKEEDRGKSGVPRTNLTYVFKIQFDSGGNRTHNRPS